MPEARPEVIDFLLSRRSRPAKLLRQPAPDADALAPILTAGLRVPDHGKLEPWELLVIEQAALQRLAELALQLGPSRGLTLEKAEKAAMSFRDAPLAIAVVSRPVPSEKIPHREQFLSAGAVCLSLVNAALASGWGASWITGWTANDAEFLAQALGLDPPAEIAGYVVIGTEVSQPPERPRPDLSARVRYIRS